MIEKYFKQLSKATSDSARAEALRKIESALEEIHSAMQTAHLLGVRFSVHPVEELTGGIGKGIDLRYTYLPDAEIAKVDAQYKEWAATA